MKLLLINPDFEGVVLTPALSLGVLGTYIRAHIIKTALQAPMITKVS